MIKRTFGSYLLVLILVLVSFSGMIMFIPTARPASELRMNFDLANSHASFIGESSDDWAGFSVAGAGDVNGDGYGDILIGAKGNDDGAYNAGQIYLIFGKVSGWTIDHDLSKADASFLGEETVDITGASVSGAGDVNGDGYDDILIGSYANDHAGGDSGQVYLIFGKFSGWTMDLDLSNADTSFTGEDEDDKAGYSVSGAGDVNGDGYDDILIGAYRDDEGGYWSGQTYLIFGNDTG